MKNAAVYLYHIDEQIVLIERFTHEGISSLENIQTLYAVQRALHLLTEDTQRLPDEWKSCYPQIEWRKIAGYRDFLVHQYLDGYEISDLWQVISQRLPELKAVIQQLMTLVEKKEI